MICVISDTHGETDRLTDKKLKKLKKFDTLIVLGDFGYLWNNSDRDKNIKKISKLPFKVLFLDGYFDDHKALEQYPDRVYRGAAAKEILPNKLYYIKRGEILDIDDMKILCFGGDDDIFEDVFGDRPPSFRDYENCVKNLKAVDYKVDYILTHSPSGKMDRFLNLESHTFGNLFTFFDELTDRVEYKKWCFGFYHRDKFISTKAQAVYREPVKLGE